MAPVTVTEDAARGILARHDSGRISAEVALMELLIDAEDAASVTRLLRTEAAASPRAAAILRLLESKPDGAETVAAMLRSGMDCPPQGASAEEGIAFCRRLFDWSVTQSEEASVALYSLGDPSILDAATREIVAWLEAERVLGQGRDALDVGCGIGRMEVALSPRVGSITGIDVSPEMLTRARMRCATLSNVRLSLASGRDLGEFGAASVDLLLAIDVFPYLVQSAFALAEAHVAEAARVLVPGGDLVILNFSYRADRARDVRDVLRLAGAHGFDVIVAGTTPFAIWDGLAFRLVRRAPSG
jgi:predicted TPR repeat methyltransferase